MVRLFSAVLIVAGLVFSGGCAKTVPLHPGAVNAFDSQAYDVLVTAQASLTQARASVAQSFPQYRAQLNTVIAAYNTVQAAYKLYHTSTAGAPSQATLQVSMDGLVKQLAALLENLGVKP